MTSAFEHIPPRPPLVNKSPQPPFTKIPPPPPFTKGGNGGILPGGGEGGNFARLTAYVNSIALSPRLAYRVFTSCAVVPSPNVAEIRGGRIGELAPTSATYQWKQSVVVAAPVQYAPAVAPPAPG